ncbi:hypothetical protein LOTGIDRAFT_176369 [Lottia gigantea]|uniref:Uncharacterized protein n=1 Tax=Lottia gigantea TaxID=225164 RepID=V4CMU7_LOTGI|nr:hypothetical protein LOTGIDRAFT_176369 [Lottia gigantea]ESP03700.1 hypothetical protein LOTGIDRAFT_176369 [Lottia gigantea]
MDDISGIKQGYGISETDPETIESPQPVDYHPFAIDTTYFAAFGPDGTNLVMRVARRPDRCAEIWLFLDLPGIGQFQHPVHPDVFLANTNGSSFECAGLKFEMLEPMLRWKINYSGLMRIGLCNDVNNKPEQYASVQMSFIWENISDCFNFDTDLSAGLICDGIAKEPWTKEFLQNIQRFDVLFT